VRNKEIGRKLKQKKTESMCEATKNGRKLTKKLEEN
jgi:hypothetical protein